VLQKEFKALRKELTNLGVVGQREADFSAWSFVLQNAALGGLN